MKRKRLQVSPFPIEGKRYRLTYWPERVGKCVRSGIEVSEIKFDGRPGTDYILNTKLERVETGK